MTRWFPHINDTCLALLQFRTQISVGSRESRRRHVSTVFLLTQKREMYDSKHPIKLALSYFSDTSYPAAFVGFHPYSYPRKLIRPKVTRPLAPLKFPFHRNSVVAHSKKHEITNGSFALTNLSTRKCTLLNFINPTAVLCLPLSRDKVSMTSVATSAEFVKLSEHLWKCCNTTVTSIPITIYFYSYYCYCC